MIVGSLETMVEHYFKKYFSFKKCIVIKDWIESELKRLYYEYKDVLPVP